MNHKQINDLKIGDRLQLIEDYTYRMEFGTAQTIPKGTIIKFIHPVLGAWRFEFEVTQNGIFPIRINFGRSRLLKLKVKKLQNSTSKVKTE